MSEVELISRLRTRADQYRQSGPSAEHTASMLDEAAAALASAQAENERLRRIQSIADCGTAENFLKCGDETKRLVFALMCEESSRRKEAEQEVERLRADLTAYATIADAYRAVTGGKGEPGNWRGAEPIKAVLEEARSQNERLREALEKTYAALKAVVMMLRDHPAMRGREHVDLGIQANAALNQSERVLAALSNTDGGEG